MNELASSPDSHARYEISADPARLDLGVVHGYLAESYWSPGIPRALVERAVANSLCLGLYHRATGVQVGFARTVTDKATFAYVADVFVLEAHRGRGLGKRLVAALLAHPDLQGLRRIMLATKDAHDLYRPFGFTEPARPERLLEILHPAIYQDAVSGSGSSSASGGAALPV